MARECGGKEFVASGDARAPTGHPHAHTHARLAVSFSRSAIKAGRGLSSMGQTLGILSCTASRKGIPNDEADVRGIFGVIVDDDEEVREISRNLDLDKLRDAFFCQCGPDDRMDTEEFKLFTKRLRLSEEISHRLWRALDKDQNGVVDAFEFTETMEQMTRARAWLRHCPTCAFENSCDYCAACAGCKDCNPEVFCPRHWRGHPDRQEGAFLCGVTPQTLTGGDSSDPREVWTAVHMGTRTEGQELDAGKL
jgi:hypothetical protein